jgi:type II secretory pathway pseudopilin PulG
MRGMVTKMRRNGFTYLGVLFAIALAGVGLALAGVVWHTAGKRAKEEQLLFAGGAIRDAIVDYYRRSPGGLREYPRTLQDLIEDRRYLTIKRHLRKIYADPITGKREWGLIKDGDGHIVGVHSPSRAAPLKRENFRDDFATFAQAEHYSDWRFIAADEQTTPAAAPGAADDKIPLPARKAASNGTK